MEQFHPVVRGPVDGLPDHTLYAPADLDAWPAESLPLVAAANGGCRNSNHGMIAAHTLIAAHGFVVIAVGAPETPASPQSRSATAQPQRLLQALEWATAESSEESASRQLRGRLDRHRIAVMGQSCGGIEAMVAAADPRVRSTLALNTGFFETVPGEPPRLGFGREHLARLHTPIVFVSGGAEDVAFDNTRANYELVRVPAVWADNPQAGHTGLWYGHRGHSADASITHEAVTVIVQWLDFTLNGCDAAGAYFLEPATGLGAVPGWTVSSRNFD
jgi:predicted alpha/beta-hydrolase family hydrolase